MRIYNRLHDYLNIRIHVLVFETVHVMNMNHIAFHESVFDSVNLSVMTEIRSCHVSFNDSMLTL